MCRIVCRSVERPWQETIDANEVVIAAEVHEVVRVEALEAVVAAAVRQVVHAVRFAAAQVLVVVDSASGARAM